MLEFKDKTTIQKKKKKKVVSFLSVGKVHPRAWAGTGVWDPELRTPTSFSKEGHVIRLSLLPTPPPPAAPWPLLLGGLLPWGSVSSLQRVSPIGAPARVLLWEALPPANRLFRAARQSTVS